MWWTSADDLSATKIRINERTKICIVSAITAAAGWAVCVCGRARFGDKMPVVEHLEVFTEGDISRKLKCKM